MNQPTPASSLISSAHALLPLRGLVITLEFTAEAQLSFFHQAAVHAFVRHLVGSPDDFARLITLDAPESGRCLYRPGDLYRFAVLGLAGADILLARLIGALDDLPDTAPVRDVRVPLRDNLRWVALHDLFSGAAVRYVADLSLYDGERLAAEIDLWRGAGFVQLQWLSPARLLLPQAARAGRKGEQRFCRDCADLSDGLLAARVHDSLADLLRRRGIETDARQIAANIPPPDGHLFWVDSTYHDARGQGNPIGGLCGRLHIGPGAELAPDWLSLLVLGQYLGIGQRRAFGLGRYRLRTPDGISTAAEAAPASSLLAQAARTDLLYDAYVAMRDNQRERDDNNAPIDPDDPESMPDPEAEEALADRLEAIGERLRAMRYQAPALKGVVIRDPDGDLRALAIPPFWDRVAQRAVNDCITPACDLLMSEASHGYRRGRSRHTASLDINRAWQDGYRWVYEADIEDFFDSVDWDKLRLRLEALYRDDPVIDLILAWMAAVVDYQGFSVQRSMGLPQGAPLSPTMANLMLDDLDNDLEQAGFRLVRYADDFVVLCRDRAQAEAAGQEVRRSLAELGLQLNDAKSRVVSFQQGFRFLGFVFMNDLVLDVSATPKDAAHSAAPKPPSPNSWLARFGQRAARALGDNSSAMPAATKPTDPATSQVPLAIGERQEQGLALMVTGASALVSSSRGRVVVTRDDQVIAEAPWRSLQAVLLLGPHHITTPALRHAMAHDVPVHLASRGGHYQGLACNAQPGREGAALWLTQRQRCDDAIWSLAAAIAVVMARIRHMREVLRQRQPAGFVRERDALQRALNEAGRADDRSMLNGIEGQATRTYFAALAKLVPDAYAFQGRNRLPPRDPFNALLSLGYSLLHAQHITLLRVAGLYPWIGFYHQRHGRHAALASDLMEPFRHIVERAALAAVGRGGIPPEQFHADPQRGCRLAPPALKRYLADLWLRLERPVGRIGEQDSYPVLEQMQRQNRRLIDALRTGSDFDAWVSR
jgi:group II intron reverse transcriptase/maturase/CRISPR-associated endonuclease Cas1